MIKGDNGGRQKLLTNLVGRVESYSLHMSLASVNLLGIIKYCFKGVQDNDLPSFKFPIDVFDQTILRNVILSPNKIDHPLAQQYFTENSVLLPAFPRFFGDGNTFTFGQKHMLTSFKNSLIFNVTKRIHRFLKRREDLGLVDKATRVWMLFAIHGWKYNDDFNPSEQTKNMVTFQRSILGLKPNEKLTEGWCKKNTIGLLKYNVYVNRFYEANKMPCFNLSPIFSIKRHFITIDTDVFYGIMRDIGAIDKNCKPTSFRDLAMDHYHSIFNINTLAGRHCEFTRTLQTDGISLVVHYQRPKKISDDKEFKIDPTHRLVGIDPGRENIYYGVEYLHDKIKSYVLTRNQYYFETGMIQARKNTQRWHKGIQNNLVAMTKVSSKGANSNRHATYVSEYLRNVESIWDEHKKQRWARQRLRLYGGKKRVFANFFKRIEDADRSRKVTVIYGSASFSPGGKGEVNVPVGRAFKECSMHFPTKVVDEYRTTAVHYFTNTMLQKVQKRRHKGTKTTVRGLLWCSSTSRNNKFVNRDLNAALNILRCANGNRPKIMTRKSTIQVDRTIGKYIR